MEDRKNVTLVPKYSILTIMSGKMFTNISSS